MSTAAIRNDEALAQRARAITQVELATYAERTKRSQAATDRARRSLPLGVPSSFQADQPHPVVAARAQDSWLEDLDGKMVVIVDDVLYTGRTIRAALDEFADFGRPRRILLCVLIDRGGRELPIQADVVGAVVSLRPTERVDVQVSELDGRDAVELVQRS